MTSVKLRAVARHQTQDGIIIISTISEKVSELALILSGHFIHLPSFMNTIFKRFGLGLTTVLVFQFARDGLMAASFTDITQPPNAVEVVLADKVVELSSGNHGQWSGDGVEVTVRTNLAEVVSLKAPGVPVKKVHLHWATTFDTNVIFLGD